MTFTPCAAEFVVGPDTLICERSQGHLGKHAILSNPRNPRSAKKVPDYSRWPDWLYEPESQAERDV